MALSVTLEQKLSYKEHCKHSTYTKNASSLKSVHYKAIGVETKDVQSIAYSFSAKDKEKNVNIKSNAPFSRLGTKELSLSRAKLPWLVITRHWNRLNPHDDLDKPCDTIPYHPSHAGAEKIVDGKKARAVTFVKNGVLLHLPLNREESKKAGQKYIPNSHLNFEINGGSTLLKTMIEGSGNSLFIYELRGEIGDDGSFSGIIKNGFILKDGRFTERLINAPIFFNVSDIYNHIDELSSELVSQSYLLAPYVKFNL